MCSILERPRYNQSYFITYNISVIICTEVKRHLNKALGFQNLPYPHLAPRISAAFLKWSAHICSPAEPRSCPTDLTTAISVILQLRITSNALGPCQHQEPFKRQEAEKSQALYNREKVGFQRKTIVQLRWVMGAARLRCPGAAPWGSADWRCQHLAGLLSAVAAGRYFSNGEHSSIVHTPLILFAAAPIQTQLIRSSYFLACALKLSK